MHLTRTLAPFTRSATILPKDANRAATQYLLEVGADEDYDAEISFSSEAPVARWFGDEILDHSPGSIDLARAETGAIVGVFNHDPDRLVWRVTRVMIGTDRRGYARIKWGVSDEAKAIRAEVEAGTLRNVSFIYRINELELEHKDEKTGHATYRSRNWEILSIDPVTIPADHGIGFGRNLTTYPARIIGGTEFPDMPENRPLPTNKPADTADRSVSVTEPQKPQTPAVDAAALHEQIENARKEGAAKGELAVRIFGSAASAAEHIPGVMAKAAEHVNAGKPADEWYRWIQEELQKRNTPIEGAARDQFLDMDGKDLKRYSLKRALLALAGEVKDGLEFEAHEALVKKGVPTKGTAGRSILVPADILRRAVSVDRRDLSASTLSAGGYLVGEQRLPMADLLRAKTIIDKLGVRRLDDAVGHVTMPRKTGSANISWIGSEGGEASEGSISFGLLRATPHTASVYLDATRDLLIQTSDTAEAILVDDMTYGIALAEDYATLSGTGVDGEPRGLRNVSGVGSVTFSSSLDYDDILEAELDLSDAHVDMTNVKWLLATNVRKFAKKAVKFANTASPLYVEGKLEDYPAHTTSNTTAWPAGNLALAKWDEILNVYWGGLELASDAAAGFLAGTMRYRVFRTMDVMVLQTGAATIETGINA